MTRTTEITAVRRSENAECDPARDRTPGCFAWGRVACAYLMFFMGALALALFWCAPLRLVPVNRARKTHLARTGLRLSLVAFRRLLSALALIRVSAIGFDEVDSGEPTVVVANHPGLLDAVILLSLLPAKTICVAKAELRSVSLYSFLMTSFGYVTNSEADHVVNRCAAALHEGQWILLFPEGTRSRSRELRPFNRGAACIALRGGARLLPVLIRMSARCLGKGDRWFRPAAAPVDVAVSLCYAVRPVEVCDTANERNASFVLTRRLQEVFAARL